jgi:hypothetical protein
MRVDRHVAAAPPADAPPHKSYIVPAQPPPQAPAPSQDPALSVDAAPSAEERALDGIQEIERHLDGAMLGWLRIRARLGALDAVKYRRWIEEYDVAIKTLMRLRCRDVLTSFGLDLDATPIERLFPLAHVERATRAMSTRLWVDGDLAKGAVWPP